MESGFTTDRDYQLHSVEIKIDSLPLGHYVLLVGSDKSFTYNKNGIAYGNFFVTNLSYVQRRTENGGYDFTVFHRENGNPIKGVDAQLWYNKYNYVFRKYEYVKAGSYTTDENGFFHIPSSKDDSYENY